MIRSFRHKGLKRLYEEDDKRGINPEHVLKLRNILAILDAAPSIDHVDLPAFRLHALAGDLVGWWSVTVRANWRVIFRYDQPDVFEVDYLDYH